MVRPKASAAWKVRSVLVRTDANTRPCVLSRSANGFSSASVVARAPRSTATCALRKKLADCWSRSSSVARISLHEPLPISITRPSDRPLMLIGGPDGAAGSTGGALSSAAAAPVFSAAAAAGTAGASVCGAGCAASSPAALAAAAAVAAAMAAGEGVVARGIGSVAAWAVPAAGQAAALHAACLPWRQMRTRRCRAGLNLFPSQPEVGARRAAAHRYRLCR